MVIKCILLIILSCLSVSKSKYFKLDDLIEGDQKFKKININLILLDDNNYIMDYHLPGKVHADYLGTFSYGGYDIYQDTLKLIENYSNFIMKFNIKEDTLFAPNNFPFLASMIYWSEGWPKGSFAEKVFENYIYLDSIKSYYKELFLLDCEPITNTENIDGFYKVDYEQYKLVSLYSLKLNQSKYEYSISNIIISRGDFTIDKNKLILTDESNKNNYELIICGETLKNLNLPFFFDYDISPILKK